MAEKIEKNSDVLPAHRGLLPQSTLDRHTGDALTMTALQTALDEIHRLEARVKTLENRGAPKR